MSTLFDGDISDQNDEAAQKAWDLLDEALQPDPHGVIPEPRRVRQIAAAQVYALLALRR